MSMVHLDERVGCVAVYRGDFRNCLSGISQDPECIFYGSGKWRRGAWYVPWWTRLLARYHYWRAAPATQGTEPKEDDRG
ncbi:MAG TPA: hypothetical protein VM537_01620 [Anaerolineae bacterium]|nr:hypothetical protein [Anaerolineae bacterium]